MDAARGDRAVHQRRGCQHITIAAAGSVSITLPIIFVIIVFQKYLVKGLASGAVKG